MFQQFRRPVYSPTVVLAVTVAIAGVAAPHTLIPTLAALMPATIALRAVLDVMTCLLLFYVAQDDDDRARLVFALTLGAAGVFAAEAFLIVPVASMVPAIVSAPPQAGSWIFIEGHLAIALGGLAYTWIRVAHRRARTVLFTSVAIGVTAAFITGGTVLAIVAAPTLTPSFLGGQPITATFAYAIGSVGLLCLIAGIGLSRMRARSAIESAFIFLQWTLALEVIVAIAAGERFSLGWCAARLLLLLGPAFVFYVVLSKLLRAHATVRSAETALEQSARRAARIRALAHVAAHDSLSNVEHAQAVIDAGRTALRNGEPMFGMISRIEDTEIVVDAVSWSGDPEAHIAALDMFVAGRRFPIAGTIAEKLWHASARTAHWNAIDPSDAPSELIARAGWRHVIAAEFRNGRTTQIMIFGTTRSLDSEPFAEDDVAFVDVLASQLAHRAHVDAQFLRIRYQMEHDQLTGLGNRTEFRKALRADIAAGTCFGLALLDLDSFRSINETSGHLIGDEVLVEVAATLAGVDQRDFVARLGGDDFGILIRGIAPGDIFAEKLSRYARAFAKPFHTGDRDGKRFISVAASIGAAIYPLHGADMEQMLRNAGVALDAAKARDGGTTVLFTESMTVASSNKHRQRVELVEAFQNDALFLEYQPTFDIATRRVAGAEALVRWNHPVRGRLQPAEFLPFAERAGLSGRVSRWVLQRVFADLAERTLPSDFRCYVNLQARLLDDAAFLHDLEAHLNAAPHLARHLGIEITESEAMHNPDRTVQALRNIRSYGLRVAIDDFGTGYSSMAYLKRLPIDVVKIDRTFIAGLPHDEKDVVLDEMFLQLTDRFGFTSLAEGIETEAQAAWLDQHGCILGQGYLISKPLAIDDLAAFIDRAAVAV